MVVVMTGCWVEMTGCWVEEGMGGKGVGREGEGVMGRLEGWREGREALGGCWGG